MRGFGTLLLVLGLCGAFFFLFLFDPSVEVPRTDFMGEQIGGGRVNNLGLMADRQNGILVSLGVAVIGILMALFAPKVGAEPGEKKCPFCAEWIKSEATVCRYCNHELSAAPVEENLEYGYRLTVNCKNCGRDHWLFVTSDDLAYKHDALKYNCPATGAIMTAIVGDKLVEMEAERQKGDINASIASMDRSLADSLANRL
jgi:hypothetical protein